ncbi:DeoR/GlpR family DNA-binding transcription regulator [Lacticaseibacillus sp. GG6-2]
MLKAERINAIAAYVDTMRTATIDELTRKFMISTNTLRRDLDQLVAEGRVKKIYGGVTSVKPNNKLTIFEERNNHAERAKRRIAQMAATLIDPGDMIFIDSGTTTAQMGNFLPTSFPFTLVTNNFPLLAAATPLTNIRLMVIGSTFDRRTQSFIGVDRSTLFARLNVKKAFMAATGISLTQGLSNSEYEEFLIKRDILARATESFLLIDHTKIERVSLLSYGHVQDLSGIVCDAAFPPAYQEFAQEHDIQLFTPDA